MEREDFGMCRSTGTEMVITVIILECMSAGQGCASGVPSGGGSGKGLTGLKGGAGAVVGSLSANTRQQFSVLHWGDDLGRNAEQCPHIHRECSFSHCAGGTCEFATCTFCT